ncbi:tRNA-splicing endonuclease subunit sen54 N-term-domain-containing protein [Biscogniauxia mediterranea]|nr:tRNA-splicing endonuclease subunit sen54 N-term-domain-containing protein [Biscogniauxia mediterranea]
MPFDDEDPHDAVDPATTGSGAGGARGGSPNAEAASAAVDDEADDKTQDFRLFNSSSSTRRHQQASGRAIRRGEKDFEAHGTRAQSGQLEASRAAMREVLGHTRTHRPRDHLRGWYFPDRWAGAAAGADDNSGLFARERVVVLESDRGTLAHTTGRVVTGAAAERGSPGWLKTWLLPEEALYLLERGSLDLWWPARGIECVFPPSSSSPSSSERKGVGGGGEEKKKKQEEKKQEQEEEGEGQGEEQAETNAKIKLEDYELGVPLSLQAAYALLIGRDGDRGKVALEKYQVYANLRRSGYKVLRATPLPPPPPPLPAAPITPARTLWEWLFALLAPNNKNNSPQDQDQHPDPARSAAPLVRPGLYRSYAQVYARLALIPRHKPSAVTDLTPPPPPTSSSFSSSSSSSTITTNTTTTTTTTPPQSAPPAEAAEENPPFRVFYHVWNNSGAAAASFTKARPPPPDFRVAVVDARATGVPTLEQMRGLLERGAPFEDVEVPTTNTTTTTQQNAGAGGIGIGGMGIGPVYRRLKHGWRNAVVAVVDGGLVSYLRFGEMAFGEERRKREGEIGNGEED